MLFVNMNQWTFETGGKAKGILVLNNFTEVRLDANQLT